MKTQKLPKTVWVGFNGEMNPGKVATNKNKSETQYYYKRARYHLSPGNEVARALNEIIKPEHASLAAKILRFKGFRVRWDAKKGRFV